jgi:hypothetical protein
MLGRVLLDRIMFGIGRKLNGLATCGQPRVEDREETLGE